MSFAGKSGHRTWVRLQQAQDQHYPSVPECAISSCVQTGLWLPAFGIFNMHADVDVCNCTWGLYKNCKRVCTVNQTCDSTATLCQLRYTHPSAWKCRFLSCSWFPQRPCALSSTETVISCHAFGSHKDLMFLVPLLFAWRGIHTWKSPIFLLLLL